jgi:mono/diheme cytochrome c family protein
MHPLFSLTARISAIVAAAGSTATSELTVDFFEQRIRPVLVEHCYECHSADAKKLKGDLRLDTAAGILKGGETGLAVVPHKPEESLLITAVRYADKDLQMPPPKDERPRKLSNAQIDDLTAWIAAGAPLPKDGPRSGIAQRAAAKTHWAFQPVAKPEPPAVQATAWVQNEIDRFVLAKLEAAALRPAPPADPRTLIRRMTFDLTGLPPTWKEVNAFVSECGTNVAEARQSAVRNAVARLLASPHYGERWGRHWLDLARYSDTKGYVYGREERFFVHAHVYRDWVVNAFNTDLPYDRFLKLQIAADQLVPPDSPDLAAMGFITGGRRFIGVTHDIIDDRIDVVTRGTMALTVQCARCHDHKYDPIPTEDYYALYGVFRNCTEHLVRVNDGRAAADPAFEKEYAARAQKLADTMQKRRDEAAARLRARVGDYLAAQLELQKYPEEGFDQILTPDDIIPASVRQWRDFLQRSKQTRDPIFAAWHALATLPSTEFESKSAAVLSGLRNDVSLALNPMVAEAFASPPRNMREVAERYGTLFATAEAQSSKEPSVNRPGAQALREFLRDPKSPTSVPDLAIVDNELFFPTSACEELWKLQGELDRWINQSADPPAHALVLFDAAAQPNPRVFKRGNPARRGEEVSRHFPTVVAGAGADAQPFQKGSGRLELAEAIVGPQNPLTARVMVNRIWLHHFGSGLVRTPSDFGLRAEPPSHAELLDWLANRFIAEGWSIKTMHTLIMTSATYQQASADDRAAPGTSASTDPDNRLLSHFNRQRLDFEEMRDALFAVSGELDGKSGGKPAEMFAANNKRRSIYGLVDRQFLPGTFRVFDFANPDLHVAQRHATTVPQQALFFLNNRFVADRAKAVATAASSPGDDSTEARVRRMHELIFQREPTDAEQLAAQRFLHDAQTDVPSSPPKSPESAWQYGWGEYDAATKRLKSFHRLPHFTGSAWQGGENWPDAKLGWAQLTADGGHAGNDLQHAVIRRWVPTAEMKISIQGTIAHEHAPGDGVRAFIVSSRDGELRSATVHNSKAELAIPSVEVHRGETLDFIVDFRDGLNSDMFKWAPVITRIGPLAAESSEPADKKWDAKKEFAGPAAPPTVPLTPWEQYAQVLLLSNEFVFVD